MNHRIMKIGHPGIKDGEQKRIACKDNFEVMLRD